MGLASDLVHGRVSIEEYRQIRAIFFHENRRLLRRPQYIIGHIFIIGSIFYFMCRAFLPETLERPDAHEVVRIAVASVVGVFVLWVVLRLLKFKSVFAKVFLPIWGAWMMFFGVTRQGALEITWEYIIYAVVVFVGWLCCCNSIKGHMCARLYMSRKRQMGEGAE